MNEKNINTKKRTALTQSIVIGSTAAIAEALVNHPLWAIKLRWQSGKAFTLNPLLLYRGLSLHMLSRIPVTALQLTTSQVIKERILPNTSNSVVSNTVSGFLGGSIAASLLAPTELIMTYQHKFGGSFLHQGANIVKTKGLDSLLTGYTGTAIRLGTYTSSFFAVQPALKGKIKNDYHLTDLQAHIAATAVSGTLSTALSNPADIIKTAQQDTLPAERLSIYTAAKKLHKQYGTTGFFRGMIPRAARVCTGVGIISYVNDFMSETIYAKK